MLAAEIPSSHAPTKRRSLMPACLRSRVPSDENVYSRTHCTLAGTQSAVQTRCRSDYDDEPFCRRRPNTICYTDPKRLASLDSNLVPRPRRCSCLNCIFNIKFNKLHQVFCIRCSYALKNGRGSSLRLSGAPCVDQQPRPLGALLSHGGQTQGLQGHLTEANKIAAGLTTTEPLLMGMKPASHHSADFLNGHATEVPHNGGTQRACSTQPNTPETCHHARIHPLPDTFLDDRHHTQKHVSFQKGMSRSTTFSDTPDDAAVEKIETMFDTNPVTTTRLMRDGSIRSTGGGGGETTSSNVRTQDASTGPSSVHRTQDAASGPSSTVVKTQDVSIGPSDGQSGSQSTQGACDALECLNTCDPHRIFIERKAPVNISVHKAPLSTTGVRTQDAATGAGCSSVGLCGARTHERLLGIRSPDLFNRSPDLLTQQQQQQIALDRLLAPVLTKALLKGNPLV
ncbi:hypothetical protein FHG87_012598 [Trinorchestia longiramus]|nr:hypothetical protein FHG87_012598 [Trinorchestia longiramus]